MFLSPELLDSRSFTAFSLGTVTPTSVAAAVCAEQAAITLPLGSPALRTTDLVFVMGVATGNATALASARVASATTIALTYCNPTAGALTPAAGVFSVFVVRV